MCFSPLQVVRTLILYGAEVDARDLSGQTPLYFAAELGKLNMTALLLEASDIRYDRKEGNDPIFLLP